MTSTLPSDHGAGEGMPMQEPRRTVIKHSAAIQIDNTITLLQRRVWNVLLFHAYDQLLCQEVHCLPLKTLARLLEYNSHDEAHLKEALTGLVRCLVSWNLLDKDGEEWGVAALLASVIIQHGVCCYAYSPPLRQRLYSPRMYARLDLRLQNRFASKYAQALWELCMDYLGTSREQGVTPWIPLAQFRKVLGVGEGTSLQPFKIFNRDVLKPALAEVNRVSDLCVTVERHRRERKVAALQFAIRRVKQKRADSLPERLPDPGTLPMVVKLLSQAGLARRDALEVWQQGFDGVEENVRPSTMAAAPEDAFLHYVQEKIHLLKQREEAGALKNPAGFLLTAIKHNYANAQKEQEVEHQEQSRQVEEQRKLARERDRLLHEQDEAWQAVSKHLIETHPEMLTEAITALWAQKDPVLTFCYETTRSALDNYHAHPPVAGAVHSWLATRFPEQFERVKKLFMDKLAAVEACLIEFESLKLLQGAKKSAGV